MCKVLINEISIEIIANLLIANIFCTTLNIIMNFQTLLHIQVAPGPKLLWVKLKFYLKFPVAVTL